MKTARSRPATMYKPLSLATSIAGGIAASAVFKAVWQRAAGQSEVPNPADLRQNTRDILIAAAVHGLIFGLVKAAIDRAGAHGYRAITHQDPV